MEFCEIWKKSKDELKDLIQTNIESLPVLAQYITNGLIEKMIRKRRQITNDLLIILAAKNDDVIRKTLNYCFEILEECIGFSQKITEMLNNLNIKGGMLSELEFAALYKKHKFEIVFQPELPDTEKTCEFKIIDSEGNEVYFEIKTPIKVDSYDKFRPLEHEINHRLMCIKNPVLFTVDLHTPIDTETLKTFNINKAVAGAKYLKQKLESYTSNQFPKTFVYPPDPPHWISTTISEKSPFNYGYRVVRGISSADEITDISESIQKTILKSKSDQFPEDTSNILIIDISKSRGTNIFDCMLSLQKIFYVIGDISGVTPLATAYTSLKPKNIPKISSLMFYKRKIISEHGLKRELQIRDNPSSKFPVPKSTFNVFNESDLYGGSYSFMLDPKCEF